MMKRKNKDEEDNLFLIVIVGVIDNHGIVHSGLYICGEDEELTHYDLWPHIRHKKWRWSADGGIKMSTNMIKQEDKFDVGDFDKIIQHIRKKYALRISNNGIHEDCCY